jgi:hypothetical protein
VGSGRNELRLHRPGGPPYAHFGALAYVLNNSRRHNAERFNAYWIDPCSSAPWFTGWRTVMREPWARADGDPPVVPAKTWLLDKGWRLVGGLLALGEVGAVHHAGGPPRR